MAIRLTVAVLLLALLHACAPTRLVRLDTGHGAPVEYRLHSNSVPIQLRPSTLEKRKERYEMEGTMRGAVARVCQDLGLPAGDSFSQDWAYELPEKFRTREFFDRYLEAYPTPGYGPAEKHVLMQLILDVANDLLERNESLEGGAWEKVVALLQADRQIHWDLIEHWALMGEPSEDVFRLTPRMRTVRAHP